MENRPDHWFLRPLLVALVGGLVVTVIGEIVRQNIPLHINALDFKGTELPEKAARSSLDARIPIDNIFQSWNKKDLSLYLAQWDQDAVQIVGRTAARRRSIEEIARKRRADFDRFKEITVRNYRVEMTNAGEDVATAYVTYSMRFVPWQGTPINETNISETYDLRYNKNKGRWFIIANRDYL